MQIQTLTLHTYTHTQNINGLRKHIYKTYTQKHTLSFSLPLTLHHYPHLLHNIQMTISIEK